MRWGIVLGCVGVAALELFVACSNDGPVPMDAQTPVDGSVVDTTMDMDTSKPETASDAAPDVMTTMDAGPDGNDSGCDASATDPRNCGRCGHDCVGGACTNGVCQPWVVSTAPASDLQSDDTNVYWVLGAQPGNVSKCARTGCDAGTPLVSSIDGPGKIAIDNTNTYFTTYALGTGILGACAKSGCNNTPTVLSGNKNYPAWFAVDSNNAYFTVYNGDIFACALPSCPDGGASITQMSAGQGLAADATYLYWTEGYAYVYSCQKSNCNNTRKLILSGQSGLRAVAAYNGNVYVLKAGANGTIVRCPNQTSCNPTVMAQNLDDPDDLDVDSSGIYFVLHGTSPSTNGSLAYCPINGCQNTPTTLVGNLSYTNAVALDKDAAYIASSGSPTWGIAKP